MIARILDTSVAVSWYLPESFSQKAREWRERMLKGKARLLIPALHFVEFANVIRTYVRRGELEKDLAAEIYGLHLEAPLELVEAPPDGILETALEFQATAYDSVFIRMALNQRVPLLTGERTTTPWVIKLGELAEVVR